MANLNWFLPDRKICHLFGLPYRADVAGRDQREQAVHPIKWKAKYGGLEVSEARRLKSLEDENRRLKKLLAEAMLDNSALKDLPEKNV